MKIFRNHYAGPGDESIGYMWFGSESDALRHHLDDPDKNRPIHDDLSFIAQKFEVPITKPALLAFLNAHCSHPDNG